MIAFVAFAALGVWQVQRRAWKLDLIARVDARIAAAPEPAPSPDQWPTVTAANDAYRRVSTNGEFLPVRPALVQALTARGAGFWVLQPLKSDDGAVIFVNRGFVPAELREPSAWSAPAGRTSVTGLLRLPEPGGGFLRTNDPAADRWFSRDVGAIAATRGLAKVAPFFIDEEATRGEIALPVRGLTIVSFPNNHLVYALTWFALAAMTAGWTIVGNRRAFGRFRAGWAYWLSHAWKRR